MTAQRHEQLRGDEAGLANTARGQVTSFVEKLDVLAREGRDMITDMDARLADFDANTRRGEQTVTEQRA
jgi:hypothetical protein